MSLFISNAIAAATTATTGAEAPQPGGSFSFVMIGAILVLFYFMLIRPQNKRAKEQRNLISQTKVGDEIVTLGGIMGKVVAVDEQCLKVTVAEGVDIKLQRSAISSVLPKGTIKAL